MALTRLTIRGVCEFDILTDIGDRDPWDVINILHDEEGERFWDVLVPNMIGDHIVTPKPADALEIVDARPYEGNAETDGLFFVRWEDWVDQEALRKRELEELMGELTDELNRALSAGDYTRVAEVANRMAKVAGEDKAE